MISLHRRSGYQGYQKDIKPIARVNWPNFNGISDRFQQNIIKNSRGIFLNISRISVDSGQRVKNLKNLWKQPCFVRIQQPDISRIRRFLYTGHHELSPLGVKVFTSAGKTSGRKQNLIFKSVTPPLCRNGTLGYLKPHNRLYFSRRCPAPYALRPSYLLPKIFTPPLSRSEIPESIPLN